MRVHYDNKEDILMIVLSNKKIDDSYETDTSIVSVNDKGEPVMLEFFNASKLLKETSKALPKSVIKEIFSTA